MKIHNLLIYTGYVESSSISCMAYRHDNGFDCVEEALENLGKSFLRGTEREMEYNRNSCSHKNDDQARYCQQCGRRIQKSEIDYETLVDRILSYASGDNNSTSYETYLEIESAGWEHPNVNMKNTVIVRERGEEFLASLALNIENEYGIPLDGVVETHKKMRIYKKLE